MAQKKRVKKAPAQSDLFDRAMAEAKEFERAQKPPKPPPELVEKMGKGPPRVWSFAEARAQEQLVAQLLPHALHDNQVIAALKSQHQVGAGRARKLIAKAREGWEREDEERRGAYRSEAIRRTMRYIAWASGKRTPDGRDWVERPDHAALARHESMLARLQGTEQPIKVEVNTRVSMTCMSVIMGMSPEQVDASLSRYRENVRLAEQYRAQLEQGQPPQPQVVDERRGINGSGAH